MSKGTYVLDCDRYAQGRDILGFNYTLDAGANTWRSEITNRRTKEIAQNEFPLGKRAVVSRPVVRLR